MQTKCSKPAAGIFAGMFWAAVAAAHPGHAPTDVAAEISQPLAGPDHFIAFAALASLLLIVFRCVLKARRTRQSGS